MDITILSKPKDENSILGFFGQYRWLSNFHLHNVTYLGKTFATNEHAYQWAKQPNQANLIAIFKCKTPGEARKLGQTFTLPATWERNKYYVMLELTREKFKNPELAKKLLETKDLYLEETNSWGDTYWGFCAGKGSNNLGQILMEVRRELNKNL